MESLGARAPGGETRPDNRPNDNRPNNEAIAVSAVDGAAAELRELVSEAGPGAFVGSLEELAHRLGVSRPTLRQSLRVLENEDLLVMRRGRGGGFYARPPTSASVSRTAGAYLRSKGVSLTEILEISQILVNEAVRLAVGNASSVDLSELAFLAASRLESAPGEEPTAVAIALGRLLTKLSGRPTLSLLIEVLLDVGEEELLRAAHGTPARRQLLEQTIERIAGALETRDLDAALAAVDESFADARSSALRRPAS